MIRQHDWKKISIRQGGGDTVGYHYLSLHGIPHRMKAASSNESKIIQIRLTELSYCNPAYGISSDSLFDD